MMGTREVSCPPPAGIQRMLSKKGEEDDDLGKNWTMKATSK